MTKKQRTIMEKHVAELQYVKDMYAYDKECLHSLADEILVEALKDLGFDDIVKAYKDCEDLGFWCA